MAASKNLDFDLVKIVTLFELEESDSCQHLDEWLNARHELDAFEQRIMNDLYEDVIVSGEYMNEEELKTRMVGLLFYAAQIDVPRKIRVFYERPLAAIVNGISCSVIVDCMVASPVKSSPQKPYFFLQEFKKAKGEKKDPEAQMLIAMLIAQAENKDDKPIYGAYMIGTNWHFATLVHKNYCVSKKYEATYKDKLIEIAFALRKLKELILNR
jgi:hypothetical protein